MPNRALAKSDSFLFRGAPRAKCAAPKLFAFTLILPAIPTSFLEGIVRAHDFSADHLQQTIQEVITLSVFSVFSVLYLGENLRWNYAAGFGCIALAVFFAFHKW